MARWILQNRVEAPSVFGETESWTGFSANEEINNENKELPCGNGVAR